MEILVWLFFDVIVEVLGELFLEFTRLLSEEKSPAPIANVWFIVVGMAIGAASIAVFPERVFRPGLFAGISLLFVPLALGSSMEVWGRFRAKRGRAISHLATWYGGGVMGLGLAVGRLGAMVLREGP